MEKPVLEDPNIVNWEKDAPDNPMNWPSSKKIGVVAVVAFITMLSPFASTMSASATLLIMSDFSSTNQTLSASVTSVYILGYAFGPLAWAPLSELYGRLPIYNICNILFLIFSIACAVANSLGALVAFRFFAGVAASCAITISSGTVTDLYPVEKRGKAMTSMILGPLFGPAVGPVAGGYLAEAKGWRWTFWLITILASAACIISFIFNRETYSYVLLKRKTVSLKKETGNTELRSALDIGRTPRQLFKTSIVRPIRMLYLSPINFLMSLVMAAVPGLTYLIDTYTVYAASVSAAATVFRSLVSALLPLAGNAMYDALGIGWGNSLLGFMAVACIPMPLLFWIYGEWLRNSKRLSRVQF
ncbi:hypothetical protein PMIN03_000327 [Paraphaeosphaeria minitans]